MEYIKQNKFYQADRLNDHVLRISGMGGEKAYVIEGTDRACLFDGCSGVGSLRAFVNDIVERKIFDGEKLNELLEPLNLGWRDRTLKETALMMDLVPLLKRLLPGQEISGLSAYEE